MVNHKTVSGSHQKDGRTTRHYVESKDHHRLIKRGAEDQLQRQALTSPVNKYGNSEDRTGRLSGAAESSAYRTDWTPYLMIAGGIALFSYTSNA